MANPVVLTPEAEEDSDQAYFWYESRRIGLGREFLTAVDACIQSIHRNPKLYQVLYKGYRRAVIRRFPYAVLYEETEAEIVVYAVFDCRQAHNISPFYDTISVEEATNVLINKS